jgi:hypothetical protein
VVIVVVVVVVVVVMVVVVVVAVVVVVDIKMGLEVMDWFQLAQGKYKWVFVSMVTNLLLAQNAGNIMTEELTAYPRNLCYMELFGQLPRYVKTAVGMAREMWCFRPRFARQEIQIPPPELTY